MAQQADAFPGGVRYEFVVEGSLSERAMAAFPDLAVSPIPQPYTRLFGPLDDETALRGMLARFDALGLTLVELRRLPD
ncbi:hypothetical protein HQ346_03740 [Rhodococcus sp. BP-252]|uniref:hypothetical protein n=1 Tax=unclassified Rhodococcus (in: high G+C Gram-positive bacteria) TaxID=192944 RepID=UPI0014318DE9|nr:MULTISPECIES: hypothetical protein [unclassified Rhodococcus (in: high G+C Gram-positive bacteria)]MBY6410849.1 hypothetical protein [Rhodococcus sp. BP-320]MBY6415326.1 hypothetical protein [Rhodococcus sp. BP-321]MBY6419941.1 hypothetical protein [Rhodococcus sp. BP-324]MBY6425405.1 hypothetical protein [Rhodococcus sp. BP-323]MBY6430532.1 hypothetical protein [Rhodococcus sp. BP-322]